MNEIRRQIETLEANGKLLAAYKAAIPIAAWLAVGDDDPFVDTDITDTFILAMSRVQTND
ncbi:MAG: hypothetical protein IIB74_10750 [Proteobacteria bacterium]|nr:hypothetical protein [Pseudomonadota bacterium]